MEFFTINDLFKLKKYLKYDNKFNFKERVRELKRRCIHYCFNVLSGVTITCPSCYSGSYICIKNLIIYLPNSQ